MVDAKYANSRDKDGATLIPPTLQEFATTFSDDISDTLGIQAPVIASSEVEDGSIFITLDPEGDFVDVAGRRTSEGYTLTTNSSGIFISGASPLGAWWGTRTVLQQAVAHHDKMKTAGVPYGSGTDSPGWATRGMMLDAGRHFYPKEFLIEICGYMSYFKQNTFHVHLSDNLYNNPKYRHEQSLELDAWFRLWSDNPKLSGLATERPYSYDRNDFEEIQQKCAARGVTIFPEIEAPGHALKIVQWKPELGLDDNLSLLNISHPATIPTMKTIWAEFLPWFHSKMVSIGADEYTDSPTEYNRFVIEMNKFIRETSNKSISIWGTFPPKYDGTYEVNIDTNVAIQHWEFFEDNPWHDYIKNNYSVINSDDTYYVVNKWGQDGGYPPAVPYSKTFNGDPVDGGMWYPNIFNAKRASDNPPRNEPLVLGSIVPLWNDYGQNATVISEAFYAWREGLPPLADKQWGGKLTKQKFEKAFSLVQRHAPGQNLERKIPSKGDVIFSYTFDTGVADGVVTDSSGNGYDGHTTCQAEDGTLRVTKDCELNTPWSTKGRDYTLSMSLMIEALSDENNATIISGSDSMLMLAPNVTLLASGNAYPLNATLPTNSWVDLTITAKGNQTFGTIKSAEGETEEEFRTIMGINGDYFHWDVIGIEAPIARVHGWTGQLKKLQLTNKASV